MPRGEAPRHGRSARVVAVGGGKGGVGKSVIASNLAAAIARLGHRTVIVDVDLGAANLHTLLGVSRCGPGLTGFLDQEVETLLDAAVPVPDEPNLLLVPGTSRAGSANLVHGQKVRLLRAIAALPVDVVIVDVGAGASFNTLDAVAIADVKLVVMTPELTSLHNAYAFLKACVQRVARRLPDDEVGRVLVDGLFDGAGEAKPIRDVIALMRDRDAALAERLVDLLVRFGVGVVANAVETPGDVAVIARMSRMISDYLLVHAPVLAAVPRTGVIKETLRERRSVVLSGPGTGAFTDAVRELARAVLATDVAKTRAAADAAAGNGGAARRAEHRPGTLPIWIEREPAKAVG